ncbi:MAG: hydrogenase maturation nickel metallochaperone HypA [Deltaproteobacteria bacterium]|nr:hydrogenase maturation nickel metallochaperone HypA [Deltaproteobacteria bacterium]MBW2051663.1 hydrogenase maturation nickel metallochaperone HypA [Deltaproteobacteria bacterium]MBW2140236.1 hydrogenase maturation nickel metallochaperone HypA [Deltaproteobacteria bacterium]MBW2323434.1 hydrogenase maturation nickel metallochaperone HypA [Deltaproteobacteria bacterium]
MHEFSIAQSIVDIVKEEMTRHKVEKLNAVNIVVGMMSGVVPQHLTACFQMIIDDSSLAGAELKIREVPLGFHCAACGNEFTAEELVFSCPQCDEANPTLEKGRELTIENIEIAD